MSEWTSDRKRHNWQEITSLSSGKRKWICSKCGMMKIEIYGNSAAAGETFSYSSAANSIDITGGTSSKSSTCEHD